MIFLISGSVIVLLVAAVLYAEYAPTTMDRDVAAIHAMGYPTTEAEIAALEPKDGPNADAEYRKFIDQYLEARKASDFSPVLYSSAKHPVTKRARADWAAKYRYLAAPLIAGSKLPRWIPSAFPDSGFLCRLRWRMRKRCVLRKQ